MATGFLLHYCYLFLFSLSFFQMFVFDRSGLGTCMGENCFFLGRSFIETDIMDHKERREEEEDIETLKASHLFSANFFFVFLLISTRSSLFQSCPQIVPPSFRWFLPQKKIYTYIYRWNGDSCCPYKANLSTWLVHMNLGRFFFPDDWNNSRTMINELSFDVTTSNCRWSLLAQITSCPINIDNMSPPIKEQ